MASGNVRAGPVAPGMLQYTNEPAVEHIAWEVTGDGLTLTILPLPPKWGSIVFQLIALSVAVVIAIRVNRAWNPGLPFLILYGAIGLDSVFRFLRDRKPIIIRLEGQRLKASGGQLLKNHSWNLWEIHEIRAPIAGFGWRGDIKSAIEISPLKGSRVTVGSGRRFEEMDWAVQKLRRAMTAAGWDRAWRKGISRRFGEWIGANFRRTRLPKQRED